jgi:hypothetical protein
MGGARPLHIAPRAGEHPERPLMETNHRAGMSHGSVRGREPPLLARPADPGLVQAQGPDWVAGQPPIKMAGRHLRQTPFGRPADEPGAMAMQRHLLERHGFRFGCTLIISSLRMSSSLGRHRQFPNPSEIRPAPPHMRLPARLGISVGLVAAQSALRVIGPWCSSASMP